MKTLAQNPYLKMMLATAALTLFLALNSFGFYTFLTSRYPGTNDFYARWRPTRAWLFEGRSPYADSVTLDTQIGMYGRPAKPEEDKGLFSYPMFSMIFFAPFALFESYAWASAAWLSVLFASLIGLAALGLTWSGWRPPLWLFALTMLFSILWYHTVRTLLLGQFAAIESLIIVSALLALRAEKDELAGILLALSTTKVQMAFLVIPGLLLWAVWLKRWKLIIWFAGAIAAMLALSFVLLPTWLFEWRAQLGKYVGNTFIGSPVSVITIAVLPGGGALPEYIVSGCIVLYMLWEWWRARGPTGRHFDWAVAFTLVVTNLVALRTATTNYVMMIPALFLLFRFAQERWGRAGLAAVALTQAILLFGIWALFLTTVKGNVEQSPTYLPLPIFLFVGLILIRNAWTKPETV